MSNTWVSEFRENDHISISEFIDADIDGNGRTITDFFADWFRAEPLMTARVLGIAHNTGEYNEDGDEITNMLLSVDLVREDEKTGEELHLSGAIDFGVPGNIRATLNYRP